MVAVLVAETEEVEVDAVIIEVEVECVEAVGIEEVKDVA